MIRHICMFTLKPENKEQTIAEFFDRAEALRKIDTIKRLFIRHVVFGEKAGHMQGDLPGRVYCLNGSNPSGFFFMTQQN